MLGELIKFFLKVKKLVGNKPESIILIKKISQKAVDNWVKGLKPNLTKKQFNDILTSVMANKWVNPN